MAFALQFKCLIFQVCCGAGTAADCNKITEMMSSQLELLRLDWNRQVKVCTALRLFKNMLFRLIKTTYFYFLKILR
jgi:20S proteasome alpha/beta subunit